MREAGARACGLTFHPAREGCLVHSEFVLLACSGISQRQIPIPPWLLRSPAHALSTVLQGLNSGRREKGELYLQLLPASHPAHFLPPILLQAPTRMECLFPSGARTEVFFKTVFLFKARSTNTGPERRLRKKEAPDVTIYDDAICSACGSPRPAVCPRGALYPHSTWS